MKKVLIITYAFPPRSGIGSQRPFGLAKYLPKYGWEPIVLTIKLPGKPPEGIRIIETDYKDITKKFKSNIGLSLDKSMHDQIGIVVNKGHKYLTWKSKFIKICKELLLFPDDNKGWYSYAVKSASNLLKSEQISVIISTSPPAISHMIAKKIKNTFGIKWIADFRDPWSQKAVSSRGRLLKYMDKIIEKITISHADLLVSVSKPYVDKIKMLHKDKKVFCITNGYDEEPVDVFTPTLTDKFTITHTGSLYSGRRDPAILLNAVSELIEENKMERNLINIRFYGSKDQWLLMDIKNRGLQGMVHLYGQIPIEEALIKQKESQLLLVIRWDNDYETGNMPAKIFEYMNANRPIMAIGKVGGIVNDILEETNAGKFADNTADLKQLLMEYYNEFIQNGKVQCNSNDNIKKYTRNIMAKKYSELLDALVENKI